MAFLRSNSRKKRFITEYITLAISIVGRVESKRPKRTVFHSSIFITQRLPDDATAAPEMPESSAWLSLVGSPSREANTDHITTAQSPAQSEMRAVCESDGSLAILNTVCATRELRSAITTLPARLQAAASASAPRGVIERVDTQVDIAFGASVQPLTRMTARTSRVKMTIISLPPVNFLADKVFDYLNLMWRRLF